MSTICKLDRRVRMRRSIRKAIRQRFAALAEAFRVTGETQGFLAYSAAHELLKRTTDHKRFLAIVMRTGQQEVINELA